jgi:hypothetical protein
VWLTGAEGGELTAALALQVVVFDPIQSPTPPIRSLYTKVIAQKAYKAQEVNQGVGQTPSVIRNGVDALAAEREEGDREMVL